VPPVLEEGDEGGLEVAAGSLRRLPADGLAQLVRRAVEEALAVGEDKQALPIPLRLLDVMGGEDHRRAALGEPRDKLPKPRPLTRIEPYARLVQQQHNRARQQANRNIDPLLIPPGQLGNDLPPPLLQSRQLEHLLHSRPRLLMLLQPSKQQKVLLNRQPPVERRLLGHPANIPVGRTHLASIRLQHSGKNREQSRLAGAIGPNDPDKLTGVGREADPFKSFPLPVPLDQPPRFHGGNATGLPLESLLMPFPNTRLRRLRRTETLRSLVRETELSPAHLIQPTFVVAGEGVREEVESMPGIERFSISELVAEATEIASAGIGAILLFGVPAAKDDTGSGAYDDEGVVQMAVRALKEAHPDLTVITDVCLCEYTSHGHCGFVRGGEVDNDLTIELLAKTAISHAEAGADAVAPSDMMDGRVGTIRHQLDEEGHAGTPIVAYSAKYASAFYGPFREAAESTPEFGDRRGYQLDPANAAEAVREAKLDLEEGADMLMVKPATPYLDVVRRVKEETGAPLAAYHVSGEYSMLKAAAENGWIDERSAVLETLTSIRRAGADAIVTYYAKEAAAWLR
jgi:porphobilinogen synthase